MEISIIISTYNRPQDLNSLLKSIHNQSKLPNEIIIIDDSINDDVKDIYIEFKNDINKKKITYTYVKNKVRKGLTASRNIGIDQCEGDIVIFLDDDTILDSEYIKQILKIYEEKPEALGVQGFILEPSEQIKNNIFDKIFFQYYLEKNKCRVLPSTNNTYPYLVNKIINCQWLSGSNQSYRKEIFNKFRFDENLKKYAFKEDLDFSYRVFKEYPDSLFMAPNARLLHNVSNTGRISDKEYRYIQNVYTFYFFYKNIDQTLINSIIFYWSAIGNLLRFSIRTTISFILKPSKSKLIRLRFLILPFIYCMIHLKEIKRSDLRFFNNII